MTVELILFVFFLARSVAVQEPNAANTEQLPQDNSDPIIDEITVYGEKTTPALRDELIAAEDDAFTLFNRLNADNGYDIICKRETRIGSQIPKRVCLTRMARNALAAQREDEGEGVMDGGDFIGAAVFRGGSGRSAKQRRALLEKMRDLANKNPELLEALKKRLAAQKTLDDARAK